MLNKKALAATAGGAEPIFIEECFSTTLYTGNSSTQTITNGIDLSGEGGMTWIKCRNAAGTNNAVFDTLRGATKRLFTDLTDAQDTSSTSLTAFTSSGFTLGANANQNNNGDTFASWTFRKAEKFFDVVTYTGNGSARTISHNLGSTPGCIIVKRTDTTGDWYVYHRSNTAAPETDYLLLNSTAATADLDTVWNDTSPTSTVFSVGTNTGVNANSGTYVAYLFAHDAGGFGDAGDQNVISCGSYSGSGVAGNNISVGFEAQWVLIKRSNTTQDWFLFDTMRGMGAVNSGSSDQFLNPNLSDAEVAGDYVGATATGFVLKNTAPALNASGGNYIYIAIRRGPMKTPTTGTSVYNSAVFSGNDGTQTYSNGFPTDFILHMTRNAAGYSRLLCDRLRGKGPRLNTASTDAESNLDLFNFDRQNSVSLTSSAASVNASGTDYTQINFRRAPGFFDVVCYTGNGSSNTSITHNLGVAPEFMIIKGRSNASSYWAVWTNNLGGIDNYLWLNTNAEKNESGTGFYLFGSSSPTSTTFNVGTNGTTIHTNKSGDTYVAYLFASLSGVSKVGSYTGNGSSVTVTTNFQPRFILVKRTDSTGNWIVSDSARGLVAGNDPYLLLNSTAAEDTDEDWVDISSTGFTVNQVTASNANVNTGTYIYLAIA